MRTKSALFLRGQEFADLRRDVVGEVPEVAVERLDYFRNALSCNGFFAIHQAVPHIATGFLVYQLDTQRDTRVDGRVVDFTELVKPGAQQVIAGGGTVRL